MTRVFIIFVLGVNLAGAEWRIAEPGWDYGLPADHFAKPDFKTEWWYLTGNLEGTSGNELGYQVTFFRQGLIPPSERREKGSRWLMEHLLFGHAAVSDPGAGRFAHADKSLRGAFGEAGFARLDSAGSDPMVWLGEWQLRSLEDGRLQVTISEHEFSLDLVLVPEKPAVVHGETGVSRKGPDPGQASHYLSLTRLRTEGTIRLGSREEQVSGWSWYDREWFTNQLAPDQTGWDWFSLQFEDDTELMLFRVRSEEGQEVLSGTFIDHDGTSMPLHGFEYEELEFWRSPVTEGRYPVAWRLEVPELDLELEVSTPLQDQEIVAGPFVYWEGMVHVKGSRRGDETRGRGYLEMTGYGGRVRGLSE